MFVVGAAVPDAPEDAPDTPEDDTPEDDDSSSEYEGNDDNCASDSSNSSDESSGCESEGPDDCAVEDCVKPLSPPSRTADPSENPVICEQNDDVVEVVEVPAPASKKNKLVQGSLKSFVKKLPAPTAQATCSGVPKDVQPVQPNSGKLAIIMPCYAAYAAE